MSALQHHPRDKVAEKLISFTGSLRFTDLEPQVLHAIKQHFIDTIGCALAASGTESSVIAKKIASAVQSSAGARILGIGNTSSPELAAFANTAMIRCLDLNDDYFGKDGPHPSDTIGAVLAAADSVHADGRAFITAVAATVGPEPKDITGAQFSSHFSLGLTIVKGSNDFESYYEALGNHFSDPGVIDVARKVTVLHDEESEAIYPKTRLGKVTLETKDGQHRIAKVFHPKGSPENPLSREELHDKFLGLATRVLTNDRAEKVLHAVQNLEQLKDIGELAELLTPTS